MAAWLAVSAAIAVTQPASATQYQVGEYTVWDNSKYLIDNQLNGTASNLMTVSNMTSSNNGITWKVDWNYTNSSQEYGLKYPAVHMGWHWGYPDHYPSATTGLPFQLASGHTITSSSQYNVANTPSSGHWSGWDVSYDMWFHWKAAPTWQDNPNYEVMIWNAYGGNQNPAGAKILSDVVIGSRHYELWGGTVNSWYCFSFRSKNGDDSIQNVNHTVSLNPTEFTTYLMNSTNTTIKNTGFSKWVYLTSVESGAENYNGTGHLYTWWYQSDVH